MNKVFSTASFLAIGAALAFVSPAMAQQGPAESPPTDVIIVYGDRLIDDPGAFSIIGTEDIGDIRANHPAEILNTVPGVNVQMNSGQELLVAIRSPVLPAGAGQGSFLILENGVPIRAPAFGNVNALFELHHETAEAIEVVRGPASVRYGSNAVHGLLNVIAPEPGGTGSAVTLSTSTLQRHRADAASRFKAGGVDMFAGLSVTDDNGWRDNSGVDMQKLTLRSGWGGDDWRAVASLSAVNLNQETAGFIQGPEAYKNEDIAKTNANPEAYRDAWAARANVRVEKEFGSNLLTVTPFAITQRMLFIQHFLPDQSTEKNGHDSFGVMTRYDFGPEAVRWSVGADVQYADGYLTELQTRPTFVQGPATYPQGLHYDYDVGILSLAGYAELDWDFAKDWSLLAGLRAETHEYDYTTNIAPGVNGRFRVTPSRKDNYDLFTPKFGVVWSGADWGSVYANYARGERAPQVSDQYRLQSLQTEDRLDVETLDSFEIGARGEAAGVRFDVAAYTMKKENFFFRDADGFNVPDGKTDHTGIEAGLDGDLPGGFRWNANLSWSDQTYAFDRNVASAPEDIVNGTQIDTAPEWLGDIGFGWANETFSIFATAEYVGEYFTNAANTASYDGHLIAHLRGAWRLNDTFEAFAIARNVFDERYADRADFGFGQDRYFPGEPANLTVGVRVRK